MAACTAIFVHGDKVQGSVQAAGYAAVIDCLSEFAVLQRKHLVLVLTVHQVHTGPNVGGVRSVRHETQGELVALSLNSVGLSVLPVGTLDDTVAGACSLVWAQGLIPEVAGVASGRLTGRVSPSPVAVNGHSAVDSLAT